MCVSASVTVFAADAAITVTGDKAERNEMVYVTVALENCADANTLAISMEYDSTVLKKVASRCQWLEAGDLQDFDITKDNGVWFVEDATDLNGDICKLAFQVKADAPIGKTNVKCTVTVKNDATVIGTYTATGTVEVTCEHVGTEGTKVDDTKHKYSCTYCQTEVTEAHTWDTGKITKPATETEAGTKEYTCTLCKATKQETIPATGEGEDDGSDTPGTGGSGDEDDNDTPGTGGSGSGNQGGTTTPGTGDSNQGGSTKPESNKPSTNKPGTTTPGTTTPDDSTQGSETTPGTETVTPEDTQEPETEENESVEQDTEDVSDDVQGGDTKPSNEGNPMTVVAVIVVIALIGAVAFVLLKKKK